MRRLAAQGVQDLLAGLEGHRQPVAALHPGAISTWRPLATPLVLSVHSVVSWDFAMSIIPGWHGTIFAPYFVAGAIYSGVGMVLTLLIPLRKALKLEHMISEYHFDNLGQAHPAHRLDPVLRLRDGVLRRPGTAATPSSRPPSGAAPSGRCGGPAGPMIICNAFVSQLLWFRKIRTNLTALFVISIFINIGMWFERYVDHQSRA